MTEHASRQLIAILLPDGQFELDWQAAEQPPDGQDQAVEDDLYARSRRREGDLFFRLASTGRADQWSDSLRYLAEIASTFVKRLALNPDLELLREKAEAELDDETTEKLLSGAPYMLGAAHLDDTWIKRAWQRLHEAYAIRLRSWGGNVAGLLAAGDANIHIPGRVYFHLVENKPAEEYPFSFMATYAAEGRRGERSRHLPLKNALQEYGNDNAKLLDLLSTVHKLSQSSELVAELTESGDIFHPIGLLSDEAYTFLREVPLYEEAGILCRIPKWWTSRSRAVGLSVSVGGKEPPHLNTDALLSFDVRLWLGGDEMSEADLKLLLAEAEGLAFLKGKWVEVNHKRLRQALEAYEKAREAQDGLKLTVAEAMRLQFNAASLLGIPEETVQLEITQGDWLRSVRDKLLNPEKLERQATPGDDFRAALRVYQERGLAWLRYMKTLGLGACLADDMGLGKTVQIIALLNAVRTAKRERTLLIVPASLIGNWTGELDKFAPSLKYGVWHPSENKAMDEAGENLRQADLVITTYGMLLKYDWLIAEQWDMLILDEAQAIKNPGTKQTRAVKQVNAAMRIAMTGTPVENRLSDLWSLFDFLNKGLLGTAKEFTTFSKRMREEPEGFQRLKQAVGPFILRRLKTDKSIISDLPDKIEMKTYSDLTSKQAVLYGKLVLDLQRKLESAEEGIERQGVILSSLTKFKQICNHPDQYIGQDGFAEADSGKFARLREICEMVAEKRERMLVFTQFKEMTEPLRAFLEGIFGHPGMVLHGGTPVTRRKEIVAAFQEDRYSPFLVLSIKAGGVGLNLTRANHVVHFDRWWNPAVENQATDRAFRIGQQNNVLVHKFITQGTIEEKIDKIIEEKLKLSSDIVPDLQESWITEMDNDRLMELMKLT